MFRFAIGENVKFFSFYGTPMIGVVREQKHTHVEMFGEVVLDKNYYRIESPEYSFLVIRGENELFTSSD